MANKWNTVKNLPPGFSPDEMILLTDGSVFVHHTDKKDWYVLKPDATGEYTTGSWSRPYSMANGRQYYASGVLRDGRVFVIGGERFNSGGPSSTLGEIFDPVAKTWSAINKPSPDFDYIQGDANGCILADGRVLLGTPNFGSNRTAIWDPDTDYWVEAGLAFGTSAATTKIGNTDEETWTLLQDGTVLTVGISNPPAAEKYVPSKDQWVPAGNTQNTLPLQSLLGTIISEIGPAVTFPDGRVFCIGATGHTGIYTSDTDPAKPGSWAIGPDTPKDTSSNNFNAVNGNIQTAIDAPCCLLPNGTVLFVAGNTISNSGFWSNPTNFYVFDPATNAITTLDQQPPDKSNDTWTANLLLLPTGQVLFSSHIASGPNALTGGAIDILTPDPAKATPQNAWRPTIANFPGTVLTGKSYQISGRQFNGLSQACSYGDDGQMATNYPIVRLTNIANQTVYYLRSFDFSSMGIATGTTIQTATVQVPPDVKPGQYNAVVIANGIASQPVSVRVVAFDCFMLADRSSYAQGEIQSLINENGTPVTIDPALYVVVEGVKPSDLSLTPSNLGNPPNKPTISDPVSGMSFEFSGPVVPQYPSLPPIPQRFIFPFKVHFQNDNMFNFAASTESLIVSAFITIAGASTNCSAVIDLQKNPSPFILHGDITHGYPWWLSVDVRVFQIKANQTRFGVHVATTGNPKDVATTFIQKVLKNLNGSPGTAGPLFDQIPLNEDLSSLALAPTDILGIPVYNFALARVRYRDTIPANNVRVFFRMWPGAQINASYNTNTLYRTHVGPSGQKIPLLGAINQEIVTIPFFAAKRIDTTTTSMIDQTDQPNVRAISPASIGETDTYYGCWLDINQPNDRIFPSRLVGPTRTNLPDGPYNWFGKDKLLSIQQLVRSVHQCIVAEIAFDLNPIPLNADPSNNDHLAQRNLSFVNVPNPGLIESRRAMQVFEVRPTPMSLASNGFIDELMFEWDDVPSDSSAEVYLPAVSADDILKLADELYATHQLEKVDEHTVSTPARGITFIPIPEGTDVHFTGLLTVALPLGIEKGQIFAVVVKQITTAIRRLEIEDIPRIDAAVSDTQQQKSITREGNSLSIDWRRVLGVFRLTIPVSTKEALLPAESRLLSIIRWIELSIPPESRWFLVFQRYVEGIAGRVQDMGGDPDQITPDPNGKGVPEFDDDEVVCGGRIIGLSYDCDGKFKGFTVQTKEGERWFEGGKEKLEELVERAWRGRVKVKVVALKRDPDRVLRIVLREACEKD